MGKGGQNGVTDEDVAKVPKKLVKVTLAEMKKHNKINDAWVSMGNKVYDISSWSEHPGGSVIFTQAGDDMTDTFNLFHPPAARKWLDEFFVGELVEDAAAKPSKEDKARKLEQDKFVAAYRELRGKFIADGFFKLNHWYYAYKFASQAALVALAAWLARQPGPLAFIAGATLLGLFWQQSGWLCHDICHNQLCEMKDERAASFPNRALGLIFGNLAQGFSVAWWKDKHNRHHAVPNVHAGESGSLFADPDIDTMPLLAWSDKMAALGAKSKNARFMIGIQKWSYLPLLCVARFSWLQQGIQFAFGLEGDLMYENSTKSAELAKVSGDLCLFYFCMYENPTMSAELAKVQAVFLTGDERRLEQALLVAHHAWVFALCAQRGSVFGALGFFSLASAVCGLLLFAVTSLGHNGLPVYEADERPDYWKLQVTTTRNISGNAFVHWLCGGLEYQVDHHLFPMMPRHSLPAAHERIVAFCAEHKIKYNEAGLFDGTLDVINHLDEIAHDFFKSFPNL